uniref:Sugar phosphate transporter domain-containing protein n=1 Tax=Zooxanthella nutricula TaxID=1333877 RepID=A0A7S2J917_9DINO
MSSFGLLSVLLVGGTCILMAFHRKADGATEPAASTSVSASLRKAVYTAFVFAAFMVVGPGLVLLNKHIMDTHRFRYPLALSSVGILASMLVSHAAVWSGLAHVSAASAAAVKGARGLRVALPISVAKAASLATGNAVYLYLGLGFIQMLKALTPCIVLAVMTALGVRRPTRAAIWFVFVIVAGTMLEVKGEMQASAFGLAMMMFSEACDAVALVLTQGLLQDHKFSVIESMYIMSPFTFACLSLAALGMEVPEMVRSGDWKILVDNSADFACAAGMGLAVNFVTMMLIQVTSSLFTKIFNTVRCICLVGLGVAVYGEVVSPLEIAGYVVALLGFAGYNYVQISPDAASAVEHSVDRCMCMSKSPPPPSLRLRPEEAECLAGEAVEVDPLTPNSVVLGNSSPAEA